MAGIKPNTYESGELAVREACFTWIARHDSLKDSRAYGMPKETIRRDRERLVEASRDLRDAIDEMGI